MIFDDAHAAEHLLRDHFTTQISRNSFSDLYIEIANLFYDYHIKIGKEGSYGELSDSSCKHIFLIPPFEIRKQQSELTRILNEARLSDSIETKFSWEFIRDRIDLCCILISGNQISITPAFVPTASLPYFKSEIRRIYLSATLSAPDAFARTFGKVPDQVIAPSTTAGECERQILFPSKAVRDVEDIVLTKTLINPRKALILVPSYQRSNSWSDIAIPPDTNNVTTAVNSFKVDTGNSKLLLAARYDGVDLPGDTCRLMVIDDLPTGMGLLERFMWEHLDLSNSMRTSIASRIVQSFGRISRGMSDHGVVIITGKRLSDWILIPKNKATLPDFLQKQVELGYQVSLTIENVDEFDDAINQCLNREEGWLSAYSEFMSNEEPIEHDIDTASLTLLAETESKFGYELWDRQYENAAKTILSTLEVAFEVSTNTGAWHCFWAGLAFELLGDKETSTEYYTRAHASHRNIPTFPSTIKQETTSEIPPQVTEAVNQIKVDKNGIISLPRTIHQDLTHLNGNGSSFQTEESIRALGQYLGMESTRPDNEFGTGPDVLWTSPDLPAFCIEVKTDKKDSSNYKKTEVGQLSDHVEWVKNNTEAEEIIPVFIGPLSSATSKANPPNNFFVIELKELKLLADKLVSTLTDATQGSVPVSLLSNTFELMKTRGLIWPEPLDQLSKQRLIDIES
ncbi:helicase C-terminal domain-containing protein [Desulfogranum japonicum]|uniref:helicase C-terminal domain-containing protein n=1 Tax=Desulfogranum japonicum TaxID=231447 RepID=UPI0012947B20|nr:helicase C-terminal domain-containing protein [Desulfogranum japonicum]